jgi:hypothetical protein
MSKKPKSAAWHNQHTATPERQQRRKEVAYMGIRQYKKLNRALRAYAQQGISTSTEGAI